MFTKPRLFALLALCFAGFLTFGVVVSEVLEGESGTIDTAILLMMRDPANSMNLWGPGWVQEFMRDMTALGGIGILALVTMGTAAYLFLSQRRAIALYVLGAVSSGIACSVILKMCFDRPRPDIVPHDSIVFTASLPSGHAMMSAVVYLTLGALLAEAQASRPLKALIMAVAAAMTIMVGISRVYLGVHWPSDVLAGWLAGASWALMFQLLMQYLKQRHLLRA